MEDKELDPQQILSLQGLTDGCDVLAGYALARTYIDQGELYAAAHCLGKHLERLSDSERFWQSIAYAIPTLPKADESIADIGESLFVEFEYEILTGSHQSYQGIFLSKPHAIDLISRVLPYSAAIGPKLEQVDTNMRGLIKELGASLSEYAGAQPNTEPRVTEERPPRDQGSRFGRLMMVLGRGLLAVAGAGVVGVNVYVACFTRAVVSETLASMSLGIAAIGAAVFNAREILTSQLGSQS